MKTSSITPAQVGAVVGWAAAQAVAFGWITSSREQLLLSVSSTAVAVAWKGADALIRSKRVPLAIELAAELHQVNVSGLAQKVATLQAALLAAEQAAAAVTDSVPNTPAPAPVVA